MFKELSALGGWRVLVAIERRTVVVGEQSGPYRSTIVLVRTQRCCPVRLPMDEAKMEFRLVRHCADVIRGEDGFGHEAGDHVLQIS